MNRETRRRSERGERRNNKSEDNGKASSAARRAAAAKSGPPAKASERPGIWARLIQFLREVRVELSRVAWPTRQQMVAFTTVTLITSISLSIVIFAMDYGMRRSILGAIRTIVNNQ